MRLAGTKAVVLALAVIVALAALGCSKKTSAEDQVRQTVRDAADAVEALDLDDFMAHLAPNFTDDHGNNRDMVEAMLFAELMRPGSIKIFIPVLDVEVQGRVARVSAKVIVIRGADLSAIKTLDDVVPEEASAFEVAAVFRLEEEKRWVAVGANWLETGIMGLL
jgi:hypothetical protein